MKKRFLQLFLVTALMVWAIPAFSAITEVIHITCSISASVSVISTGTNWTLGTLTFSKTTNRPTASMVSNDGAAAETFSLSVANSASWSAGASPAVNVFTLRALFGAEAAPQPSDGLFIANDEVQTAGQDATSSVFGDDALAELLDDAVGVLPAEKRSLWFRLQTPTGGFTAAQTIDVTISATIL